MVSRGISWESLGPMIALHVSLTAKEYEVILQDQVQTPLPPDVPIFHDKIQQPFHEHQDEVKNLFA